MIAAVAGAEESKVDRFSHFPSGVKTGEEGIGLRSQRAEVAKTKTGWLPYNPYDPSFRLRAGLCGDTVDGREHRRDGIYYDGGRIAATFRAGGVLEAKTAVTAHHNGFMELHLCDVAKCGGEINRRCFLEGHCVPLERAGNDRCENRDQLDCAPKDPLYPSRWYLPCASNGKASQGTNGKRYVLYGDNGSMRYRLPDNIKCEHCVVQWYWTAGNTCNPPGVREFFTGDRGPRRWGTCEGQAGASGGFVDRDTPCHGFDDKVPEEYYQCSDVRILEKASNPNSRPNPFGNPTSPPPSPSSKPPPPSRSPPPPPPSVKPEGPGPERFGGDEYVPSGGYGLVRDLVLVKNGLRTQSLKNAEVKYGRAYTIEAVTTRAATQVRFQIRLGQETILDVVQYRKNGDEVDKRWYLLGTNRQGLPIPWSDMPRRVIGRTLQVTVTGRGKNGVQDADKVHFRVHQ